MWTKIRAWYAKFKWVVWAMLAGLVGATVFVLRRILVRPKSPDAEQVYQLPAVPPSIQRQVDKAEEQAVVAQIQATTKAEIQKEELTEVLQIPDGDDGGAARRKRLAALLKTLN